MGGINTGGDIPVYNATILTPTVVKPVEATPIEPYKASTLSSDIPVFQSGGRSSNIDLPPSPEPSTPASQKPTDKPQDKPEQPAKDQKPTQTKPKADPKPKDDNEAQKKDEAKKLGHSQTFTSVADPHVTSASGAHFDNANVGNFVLARSKSGDLEVEAQNEHLPNETGVWQTKGGVKTNGNTVTYDAKSNSVEINGKKVLFTPGRKIDLPGGGYVEMSKDQLANGTPFNRLQVHTKQGDTISMLNFQRKSGAHQLDIVGNISGDREEGEVTGSAGAIDGDKKSGNDFTQRNGQVTADVASFLESWRANADEDLFK